MWVVTFCRLPPDVCRLWTDSRHAVGLLFRCRPSPTRRASRTSTPRSTARTSSPTVRPAPRPKPIRPGVEGRGFRVFHFFTYRAPPRPPTHSALASSDCNRSCNPGLRPLEQFSTSLSESPEQIAVLVKGFHVERGVVAVENFYVVVFYVVFLCLRGVVATAGPMIKVLDSTVRDGGERTIPIRLSTASPGVCTPSHSAHVSRHRLPLQLELNRRLRARDLRCVRRLQHRLHGGRLPHLRVRRGGGGDHGGGVRPCLLPWPARCPFRCLSGAFSLLFLALSLTVDCLQVRPVAVLQRGHPPQVLFPTHLWVGPSSVLPSACSCNCFGSPFGHLRFVFRIRGNVVSE